MMFFKKSSLIVMFAICFFTTQAANITWTNNNGTNLWSDPLNWSSSSVPGTNDVAIFNITSVSNCNIDVNINVKGLWILTGYTGTITQLPGVSLTIGSDDFLIEDGTFLGGNSSIQLFYGNFSQSGGTFQSTSGIFDITGIQIYVLAPSSVTLFDITGGNFLHNNGTIIFNREIASLSTTPDSCLIKINPNKRVFNHVQSDIDYYFLIFYPWIFFPIKRTGILDIQQNDTLYCDGNFSQTNDFARGVTSLKGNLDMSDPASEGYFGHIVFEGSANQTYYFDPDDTTDITVIVDKPSGTVSPDPNNTAVYVSRLILNSGNFVSPSNFINIGKTYAAPPTSPYFIENNGGTFTHNSAKVIIENPVPGKLKTNNALHNDFEINSSSNLILETQLLVQNNLSILGTDTLFADTNYIQTLNLNNNGTIHLANNAALIQKLHGTYTGTGQIIMERQGLNNDFGYNIWSSPISSASFTTVFPGTNPCDIWTFEQSTQNWKYDWPAGHTTTCSGNPVVFQASHVLSLSDGIADGIMDIGRGYFIPGSTNPTRVFTGVPNNGAIQLPIESTGLGDRPDWTGDDWNLIGNPYPSAIDLNLFWQENAINNQRISDAVYFWDDDISGGSGYHHQDDYASWNSFGGTASANSSKVPLGYVGAGQGFWVSALTDTIVEFNNSMRTFDQHKLFFKTNPNEQKIWIRLYSDSIMSNQILTGVSPLATDQYDPAYDAHTFSSAPLLSLASVNDSDSYLIQAFEPLKFNSTKRIPLLVKTTVNGLHIFKADSTYNLNGLEVFLYDVVENKIVNIVNINYTVDLSAGEYANRFYLIFSNHLSKILAKEDAFSLHQDNDAELTTYINYEKTASRYKIDIHQDNDFIYIESPQCDYTCILNVIVYDASGRILINQNSKAENNVRVSKSGLRSGVYFIQTILNGDHPTTEKIIVFK